MSVKAAALSIHELAGAERQAVLRALSPDERDMIMPLLEQLSGLGVPAGLASRLQLNVRPKAPIDTTVPDGHRRCASLSAETIMKCTETQSEQTVGALLAIRSWPWTQELLLRLSEPRRRAVQACCQGSSGVAPAVQAVLVDALVAAAARHDGSATRRTGFLRRLMPWTQ